MPKQTVDCDHCGDEIERWPSHINDTNFCDRECSAAWKSEHQTGPAHPNFNSKLVKCDWCDNELKRPPWRIEKYDHQFCDADCKGAFYSEHPAELHQKERYEVECTTCGATLERIQARVDRSDVYFCDRECKGEWWSDQTSGEDHVLWAGGWDWYYGANWQQQRRRARKRDGYECWCCGVTDGQCLMIHGKELEVHHVEPLRTHDDLEEANRLSNLLTVCSFCHQRGLE